MRKLLILAILAVLAYLVWQEIGANSLLFVLPVVAGVLYGANGSIFVETPYIPQEGDDEATVFWSGKGGTPYINKDGVTYEMVKKGWKYNWARRMSDGEK